MFTLCKDTTGQRERETFNHSKVSLQEDWVESVALGVDKELQWKGGRQREKLLGMVPNFS